MTTTAQTTAPPQGPATSPTTGSAGYRYRWMVLAVVLVADVMDLLDATIANLAGPSIRADLGGSASTLQWVLAAYTLSFAIGLITSARLGDLVGRRRMFIIGMVGFTAASLACGLAPSAGLLIAARVAQGLFGATMIPQGLAMVKQSFPPEQLNKAFIPFGPVMGLAAVLGPIIAGVLIDADLFGSGWRMCFLINLPVGIVASYLAFRYLPEVPKSDRVQRLDLLGTLLITAASAALIFPLVQGHEAGWPAWTFALMGLSVVLFGLFAWNERRSDQPLIEPSLFRNRAFVAGLLVLTTFFLAMSGLHARLQPVRAARHGLQAAGRGTRPDALRLRHRAGVGPVRCLARTEARPARAAPRTLDPGRRHDRAGAHRRALRGRRLRVGDGAGHADRRRRAAG